jgi:hypothetical protein
LIRDKNKKNQLIEHGLPESAHQEDAADRRVQGNFQLGSNIGLTAQYQVPDVMKKKN